MNAHIINLSDLTFLYESKMTNFENPKIGNVWYKLIDNCISLNDQKTMEYFGLYKFLSEIENTNNVEYRACIKIRDYYKCNRKFIINIDGGKYARFNSCGLFKYNKEIYNYVYGEWIFSSGIN